MSARNPVVGATRSKVLDLLIRHADLDGLAIVPESEIATALGISQESVSYHVRLLAAEGVVSIVRFDAGANRSMNAIQLPEDLIA